MLAGFSRVEITPAVGTRLMGWGLPSQRRMTGVHDPLYARALVASAGGQDVAIVALDLCFIGREDSQRIAGLIARKLGWLPHQLMLAATHTHAGPEVGSYYEAMISPPQRDYLAQLDDAVLRAIREALANRRAVRLKAARGRTSLPMNRRPLDQHGKNSRGNAPNRDGPVQDAMPICLLEDMAGEPVCLIYSIATHPVCFTGTLASADYIGVACDLLDERLGATCSLFLQGCAGDSRPRTLQARNQWVGSPGEAQIQATGAILAKEVQQALAALRPASDGPVAGQLVEVYAPLQPPLAESEYQKHTRAANPVRAAWAERQLALINRGTVTHCVPLLLHAVQLGPEVRLIAIEGEPLHPYAAMIERAWPRGTTFPLGYVHGEGLYLVTTPMLEEGGYEPESYWEYNHPSPLAAGVETVIATGLAELQRVMQGR